MVDADVLPVGSAADAQLGQGTPARQSSIGQGGQVRPSPRHKIRQPQCPPHKDAKGFTMGRGKATPPTAPAAPGSTVPAGTLGKEHLGQQLLQQLQQPQAGRSAAPHIGQAFLEQLQAGPISAGPTPDLGKGFLQQLQQGGAAHAVPPANAQPQLDRGMYSNSAAALNSGANGNDAGRALLSQLHRPAAQPNTASAQTQGGATPVQVGRHAAALHGHRQPVQKLHAQTLHPAQALQSTSGTQPVQVMQQSTGTQPALASQPNAGTALLEQLLGSSAAAAAQDTRPGRGPNQAPPGLQHPSTNMASNSAASFQQMLRTALAKQPHSRTPPGFTHQPPSFAHGQSVPSTSANSAHQLPGVMQSQPVQSVDAAVAAAGAPPPGFSPTHLSPARQQNPSAPTPGFSHTHLSPAQHQSSSAGRQLLQQLQQAGSQSPSSAHLQTDTAAAAGLQPSTLQQQQQLPAALGQHQAPGALPGGQFNPGQMLLQQLQRSPGAVPAAEGVGISNAPAWQAGSAAAAVQAASVGGMPAGVEPSAPPAPAAMLLEAAGQTGGAVPQGRGLGRGQGRAGRGRTGDTLPCHVWPQPCISWE